MATFTKKDFVKTSEKILLTKSRTNEEWEVLRIFSLENYTFDVSMKDGSTQSRTKYAFNLKTRKFLPEVGAYMSAKSVHLDPDEFNVLVEFFLGKDRK